jgi:hypothetical protein
MFDASAIRSRKKRSLDAVKREDLLGHRLVLRHENGMRPRARVAQSQQVDVSDHVHFLGVVAPKRLGQVENEVGIAARERVQRLRAPIELEIGGLVPQFLQRFKNFLAVSLRFFAFFTFFCGLRPGSASSFAAAATGSSFHTSYSSAIFSFAPIIPSPRQSLPIAARSQV